MSVTNPIVSASFTNSSVVAEVARELILVFTAVSNDVLSLSPINFAIFASFLASSIDAVPIAVSILVLSAALDVFSAVSVILVPQFIMTIYNQVMTKIEYYHLRRRRLRLRLHHHLQPQLGRLLQGLVCRSR